MFCIFIPAGQDFLAHNRDVNRTDVVITMENTNNNEYIIELNRYRAHKSCIDL